MITIKFKIEVSVPIVCEEPYVAANDFQLNVTERDLSDKKQRNIICDALREEFKRKLSDTIHTAMIQG